MKKTILDEAKALIHGDRQRAYGHPAINLKRIAAGWNVILEPILKDGKTVTPEQVCWMMNWLKTARNIHRPKVDNETDAIAYIALIEMIREHEAQRPKGRNRRAAKT